MSKDKRYRSVKSLIESGHIKTFIEVFDTISKSRVAQDFGTNNVRFTDLINDPLLFRVKELYLLAKLFEVEEAKIWELVQAQITASNSKKKKP